MREASRICFLVALIAALVMPNTAMAAVRLDVAASYGIFPVVSGLANKITVTLDAPAGKSYAATATCSSGLGVIVLPGGSGPRAEFELTPGEPLELSYRWGGPVPTDAPQSESIMIEMPELGVKGEVRISVGMDLRPIGAIFRGIETPEAGSFYNVEFILSDKFHADADLPPLFEKLGLFPELKVELVPEGTSAPVVAISDPVADKFLGRKLTATAPTSATWPSAYEPGTIKLSEGGGAVDAIWVAMSGKKSGFVAPSSGKYKLRATLVPKANVGTRTFETDVDVAAGQPVAPAYDIAGPVGSTLRILKSVAASEFADRTDAEVRSVLSSSGTAKAAELLGVRMSEAFSTSQLHTLGRYSEAMLSAGGDVKGSLEYLRNFLAGYGGFGVLAFTRSGVSTWSITSAGGENFSTAPNGLRGVGNSRARIFAGNKLTVIPFAAGEKITLHMSGSGNGAATIWKVVPQGVNTINYQPGEWEKEITVYTDRLSPPKE